MVKCLGHPDFEVRRDAVAVLAKLVDASAVEPILAAMAEDEGREVQYVNALGPLGIRAVEPLGNLFLNHELPHVRGAAGAALRSLGPSAMEFFVAGAESALADVRECSAGALVHIAFYYGPERGGQEAAGTGKVLSAMKKLLADESPEVRDRMLGMLQQIPRHAQYKRDLLRNLMPLLVKELGSEDVGWKARNALLGVANDAVSPLLEVIRTGNARARRNAMYVLGATGDPRVTRAIMDGVRHGGPGLEMDAAIALARIYRNSGPQTVATLVKYLQEDKRAAVRATAAQALAEYQGGEAADPLMRALTDESAKVRARAARSLGYRHEQRAVETLIRVLSDEAPDVRYWAAWALARIEDPRAVEPLVRMLDDREPRVRRQAAAALGEIPDKKALEPLLKALVDPVGSVRVGAVHGLGGIGGPAAVEALLRALRDREPEVRSAACWSLEGLGDRRAIAPLTDALGDTDGPVRSAAAAALLELGGDDAPELFIAALAHKHEAVREHALSVLRRETKKDFGEDADGWRRWWRHARKSRK